MRFHVITCLILLMILPCVSFAQNDAGGANWGFIDINDFSGGMNTRDGAGVIADNELQSCNNCYLLAKGIAKRNGYERYNSSARIATTSQGTGIINAPFTGGSQVVATAGTAITKKGTGAWTDITDDVTITANKPFLFDMINNVLVGVNGTDSLLYYTGSGNADAIASANMPTAPTAVAEYHGRLFLSQGRRLYWSNYLGDWQIFHPDDYEDFEENITGLHVLGEMNDARLIVTTRNSVHSCLFDPSLTATVGGRAIFQFDTISNKNGCISPYSMQECLSDDGQLFLVWADRDGLKALLDNAIIKLTDKIQPTWDALNISVLDESIGLYYTPKKWYVFVCSNGSSTDHNSVIIYDLRHMAVSGVFDWGISSLGIIPDSDDVDRIVGSDYTGYWNTYDKTYNDNGETIGAYFETKSYDNQQPWFDKTFRSIGIQHNYLGAYTFNISIFYDYSEGSYETSYTAQSAGVVLGEFLLGTDRLYGTGGLVIKSRELRGQARSAFVKISNYNIGESFQINKLQVIYELGRMVLYR